MYDPIETDVSYEYLLKLNKEIKDIKWAVIGGWGVFLNVKREYLRAFGTEYLKSRDIDIFIEAKYETKFLKIIRDIGFIASAYKFRYELIYDRENKRIVSSGKAKNKDIFNLAYVFLDIFSNKKTNKLGSWVFPELVNAKIESTEGFPVLDVNLLLSLKINSFFEREKLDKELKDACDIYALVFYSGKNIKINLGIKNALGKIISRQDLQDYIAEHVLGDVLKASLVLIKLQKYLNK